MTHKWTTEEPEWLTRNGAHGWVIRANDTKPAIVRVMYAGDKKNRFRNLVCENEFLYRPETDIDFYGEELEVPVGPRETALYDVVWYKVPSAKNWQQVTYHDVPTAAYLMGAHGLRLAGYDAECGTIAKGPSTGVGLTPLPKVYISELFYMNTVDALKKTLGERNEDESRDREV